MAKIGDILIQKGLLTKEQLEAALKESQRTGEVLGKVLIRLGLITQDDLLKVLAEQLGLPFYSTLKDITIPEEVIKAIPAKFVWHYKFMPLSIKGRVLTIAISDPLAVWPMEDLRLHLGYEVERVLVPEEEILKAIRKYYGVGAETVEEILAKEAPQQERKVETQVIEDLEKAAGEASVIRLVNQILSEAVSSRATDIHIEPYSTFCRIRLRVD